MPREFAESTNPSRDVASRGSLTLHSILQDIAELGGDEYGDTPLFVADSAEIADAAAISGTPPYHKLINQSGETEWPIAAASETHRINPDSVGVQIRPTVKIKAATNLLVGTYVERRKQPDDPKRIKALAKGFGFLLFGEEAGSGIIHHAPMLSAFPVALSEAITSAERGSRRQDRDTHDVSDPVLKAIRFAGRDHLGAFECEPETYENLFHVMSLDSGTAAPVARELVKGLFEGHQRITSQFALEYAKAAVALGRLASDVDALRVGVETLLFKNGVLDPEVGGRKLSAFMNTALDNPQVLYIATAIDYMVSLATKLGVGDKSDVMSLTQDSYYRDEFERAKRAMGIDTNGFRKRATLLDAFRRSVNVFEGSEGVAGRLLERPEVQELKPSIDDKIWLLDLADEHPDEAIRELLWAFRLDDYMPFYVGPKLRELIQAEADTPRIAALGLSDSEVASVGGVSLGFREPFGPGTTIDVYGLRNPAFLKNIEATAARLALQSVLSEPQIYGALKDAAGSIEDIRRKRRYDTADQLFSDPVFSVLPTEPPTPVALVLRAATDLEQAYSQRFEFPAHLDIPPFRRNGVQTITHEDLKALHEQQRSEVFAQTNRWPGRYGFVIPLNHPEFEAAGIRSVAARADTNGLARIDFHTRSGDQVTYYQDRQLNPYAAMVGEVDEQKLLGLNYWALRAMKEFFQFIAEHRDRTPEMARRVEQAIKNFDPMVVFTRGADDGSPGVPSQRQIDIFLHDNPGMSEADFWRIYTRRKEEDPSGRGSTWRRGYETVVDRKPVRIQPPPDLFDVL